MESLALPRSKKELALLLSKLGTFSKPKYWLEQYSTPSEYAAELLWLAFTDGYIFGKVVVDLGAGTGILGIGALLLGAKKVIFVEKDKDAIDDLERNIELFGINANKIEIIEGDFGELSIKADTAISNPPFGRQSKESKAFLRCLLDNNFENAYFFWEEGKFKHLKALEKKYTIEIRRKFRFLLPPIYEFHIKKRHYFNALIVHARKKENA